MRYKVIITGAGGAASIGFCRSLYDADTDYEIVGVDCSKYHLSLADVDHKYLVPRVDDPDYIEVLNHIAEKHQADFLHSQPDTEIEFLSAHRGELKVRTNFPPEAVVRVCMDKWKSYKAWKAAGVKVPRTLLIQDEDGLSRAFKDLGSGTIWIRSTKGAGGKGSLPTSDIKEACAWVNLCNGFGRFTAAELLSDRTVTWSSIWDKGELVVAQGRERLCWGYSHNSFSGVTGLTGTGITVSDKVVDDVALASILAIDPVPNGIFSVDMTYDSEGVPNPTEINIGRFFTTHHFFTRAGVNFPDIFVRLSLGLPLDELARKVNPLPSGLAWVRGMDSEPVLVELGLFSQFREELKRMREDLMDKPIIGGKNYVRQN